MTHIVNPNFSEQHIAIIEQRISELDGCFPSLVHGKIGHLSFQKFATSWNSAEKRIFILYAAIVVFRKIVSPQVYTMVSYLWIACRLISGSRFVLKLNEFLKSFYV